jgi:hypothetical protein
MSLPPAGMSASDIESLMREVSRGAVTPRTALSLMTVNGIDRHDAAKHVFYALGGSDHTELDANGRPRYVGSGKLVLEIERALEA